MEQEIQDTPTLITFLKSIDQAHLVEDIDKFS